MVKCRARNIRADAKRVIQQGGLQINGETIASDVTVTIEKMLHAKYMIVKVGKKHYSLIHFEATQPNGIRTEDGEGKTVKLA